MRRFPIVNQGRCVAQDWVYKSVPFKAGNMALMRTTLHGLDERAFPNPLEVDFNRPTSLTRLLATDPTAARDGTWAALKSKCS